MDSNDKLYNLYLELEPVIAGLEEERKKTFGLAITVCNFFSFIGEFFLKFLFLCLPSIIVICLLVIFISKNISIFGNILGGSLFLLSFAPLLLLLPFSLITIPILFIKFNKKQYQKNFQNRIILPIINLHKIENVFYEPNDYISVEYVKKSLLLSSNFKERSETYYKNEETLLANYTNGNNFISGQINSTDFGVSLLNGVAPKYDRDIYTRSIFIAINLPKKIKPFGTNSRFGGKILLDNPEFNNLFTVYAEDITEAFYLLPSNLLERIVNFVRKTGRKFDFSVVDDKFYIAIPSNRELLEPPIFKSLFDYSIYEEYLTDLELMVGIIEDLKVNKGG